MKHGQNISTAVMARRTEAPDALDDFPTPPWATRALCGFLARGAGHLIGGQDVWEPCANRGHMVAPLAESFQRVYGTDVFDYGAGFGVRDFLFPGDEPRFDWIITNPPFNLSADFVLTAIDRARVGVAMFLRSVWTEGGDRYEQIFKAKAPTCELQFSERVVLAKGVLRDPAKEYFDEQSGKMRKPSSATAYSWFVWDVRGAHYHNSVTATHWIPPGTRLRLERPGDYPPLEPYEDPDQLNLMEAVS